MLLRLSAMLPEASGVTLDKYVNNENASLRGAFSLSEKVTLRAVCKRQSGVAGVLLRLEKDGGECRDIPFSSGCDGTFETEIDMSMLGTGLYFYSVLFLRGGDTLFSDSVDNVSFRLSEKAGKPFMLTVYSDDFTTPRWFHGGVMYHIFVDRFAAGGKNIARRSDAVYEENWNAPISQYGEYPGAPVKNNLFYGGNLYGIIEKLDYLRGLGVSILYLSPIFKAYSNHKYDTGDYMTVDECFGGREAFDELVSAAEKCGMRVILDGVFNHTGDDSLYFNRYEKYPSKGAYNNESSPYRRWYSFEPDGSYAAWWGIEILPKLNHNNEACRKYFTDPKNGVGAHYVTAGTGGWRLDVADELPDCFLDEFRAAVKGADPEAVIIGEVWENAADKISYGHRRRYLQGRQLDSVMNYPFRTAVIDFVLHGNGEALGSELTELYSAYPKCVADSLMNIVGTHDTERILTVLGDKGWEGLSNRELSVRKMSAECRAEGISKLKVASVLQYTVYGVPSVFYGDEAGAEGCRDPFCRSAYPWGSEEKSLVAHYKSLGKMRMNNPVFAEGTFRVLEAEQGYICFERTLGRERVLVAANTGAESRQTGFSGRDAVTGKAFDGMLRPMRAAVIKQKV